LQEPEKSRPSVRASWIAYILNYDGTYAGQRITDIAVVQVYTSLAKYPNNPEFGIASLTFDPPAVSPEIPVPEPATLSLLGLGLAGAGRAVRRRGPRTKSPRRRLNRTPGRTRLTRVGACR